MALFGSYRQVLLMSGQLAGLKNSFHGSKKLNIIDTKKVILTPIKMFLCSLLIYVASIYNQNMKNNKDPIMHEKKIQISIVENTKRF